MKKNISKMSLQICVILSTSVLLLILSACSTENRTQQFKPPKNGGIYVVAHQGAHEGIPGNSLAAYQKAIDLGVDFVEVDISTTKDGEFVSIHNSTIDSYVEGKTGEVNDFTLAEVKALDIGKKIGKEWEGTRIPTFEEILDLCKNKCGIYLDLKEASIPALVSLIEEKGMVNHVIWCLNDYKEMSELNKSCPECILMPDPRDADKFEKILAEFKPILVAPVWRDLSRELITMSHQAGAKVIVDEKDENSWIQALEWGVDGIQTDHPERLINYLRNKKWQCLS